MPVTVQHGFTFLPDPQDGSLYILGDGNLKKLPFTIPQLVQASPCKSTDGVLYAGKNLCLSTSPFCIPVFLKLWHWQPTFNIPANDFSVAMLCSWHTVWCTFLWATAMKYFYNFLRKQERCMVRNKSTDWQSSWRPCPRRQQKEYVRPVTKRPFSLAELNIRSTILFLEFLGVYSWFGCIKTNTRRGPGWLTRVQLDLKNVNHLFCWT